jgi:hypothetical protein
VAAKSAASQEGLSSVSKYPPPPFKAIKLVIFIWGCSFFVSYSNVTSNYNIAPIRINDYHYEISFNKIFPEAQLFVREGNACIQK